MNKNHPLYQEDLKAILSVPGIDTLSGKTVLVTGATGLIGVQLIDALMLLGGDSSSKQVRIIAVGRSKSKAKDRLGEYFDRENFCFLEHDITMPFPELTADFIIPLASNTHPMAYSQYPVETIMANVKGAEHALELARKCDATVLYPSSVEVYGNATDSAPFAESATGKLNLSNSRSCYTESKRLSESLCQSYFSEFGVDVRIARLSRVFGPTMLSSDTKASSQFIQKAVSGDDIVLKSTGEQYFSYTYVADAVAALLYILLHGESAVAYNISNPACDCHLKDFAAICARIAGTSLTFDLPSETERKGYSVATQAILDSTMLKNLGFTPRFCIEDAISRTVSIVKG